MRRLALGFVSLLAMAACSSGTQVSVHNYGSKTTTVVLRNNSDEYKVQFKDIAAGKTSELVDIDWPASALFGVHVETSDGYESGAVDLDDNKENEVRVFDDGTKPSVISSFHSAGPLDSLH